MRAFVALPVSTEVKAQLGEAIRDLSRTCPRAAVRWTLPEQIHLTLRFLGETPEEAAGEIAAALRAVCSGFGSLSLGAERIGAFPSASRPRVIWAGVTGDLSQLGELQRRVGECTAAWGVPDDKPFHPHLTLGRLKPLARPDLREVAATLEHYRVGNFPGWTAARVQLMRSELAPSGSRHSELAAIPLLGTGATVSAS